MISKGLFTQIAMIALAVGIVFTYIKPAFTDTTGVQDDIALYQVERQKISEVNSQLAGLMKKLETVSSLDQRRLFTYMPDEVDTIDVPRIIQSVTDESGVLLKQISYGSIVEVPASELNIAAAVSHNFTFNIEGTYAQIKETVSLLEQNEFPIEIHSLAIDVLDGGFLSGQFEVITYAHSYPGNGNKSSN